MYCIFIYKCNEYGEEKKFSSIGGVSIMARRSLYFLPYLIRFCAYESATSKKRKKEEKKR